MTTKEILIAAKTKVEQGWTQRHFARLPDGKFASWQDPSACAWCMTGAVYAAAQNDMNEWEALCLLESVIDSVVVSWNDADGRTQAEVLAAFDRAIEKVP